MTIQRQLAFIMIQSVLDMKSYGDKSATFDPLNLYGIVAGAAVAGTDPAP